MSQTHFQKPLSLISLSFSLSLSLSIEILCRYHATIVQAGGIVGAGVGLARHAASRQHHQDQQELRVRHEGGH